MAFRVQFVIYFGSLVFTSKVHLRGEGKMMKTFFFCFFFVHCGTSSLNWSCSTSYSYRAFKCMALYSLLLVTRFTKHKNNLENVWSVVMDFSKNFSYWKKMLWRFEISCDKWLVGYSFRRRTQTFESSCTLLPPLWSHQWAVKITRNQLKVCQPSSWQSSSHLLQIMR